MHGFMSLKMLVEAAFQSLKNELSSIIIKTTCLPFLTISQLKNVFNIWKIIITASTYKITQIIKITFEIRNGIVVIC